VFYRRDTHIILNNDEPDSVRLLAPDGTVVDGFDYEQADYDVSYSRSQGCEGEWMSGWPPSPGDPNASSTPMSTVTPSPSSTPTPSATATGTLTATHTPTPSVPPSDPGARLYLPLIECRHG